MSYINELYSKNPITIIMIFMGLITISIVWNIVLTAKMSKLNNKYKKLMRGSNSKNLEAVLEEYLAEIKKIESGFENKEKEIVDLKNQADKAIQKCNMVRYNAFNDTGSDLSYSIAMLDNYNNGVVLTGIYGRNETITYAKPIYNSESKYPLSVEEQLVLDRCTKKSK